jgi:hypothetical protein
MATLTGVKPGEGWRPVNTIPDHPAVVRIHGFDERIGGMRHIGSGFLIGNIQNRWPIVATAAHVIQDMDEVLGLRPRVPPALDIKEPPSGEVTRQRMDRIRGKIICDVWIPSRGTHAGIGVEALEVCNDPSQRDTALLFMRLREPEQLHLLRIDTERAPEAGDNVLVAGFGKTDDVQLKFRTGESGPVPKRDITIREGFLGEPRGNTSQMRYPVLTVKIPTDGGMSGGPVISRRSQFYLPGDVPKVETVVGIINSDCSPLGEDAAKFPDTEGETYATDIYALVNQEVLMPYENENDPKIWVPFNRAMGRVIAIYWGPGFGVFAGDRPPGKPPQ